jgi:hypothetical protein
VNPAMVLPRTKRRLPERYYVKTPNYCALVPGKIERFHQTLKRWLTARPARPIARAPKRFPLRLAPEGIPGSGMTG